MSRLISLVALTLALFACGGESSTGPGGGFALAGAWNVTVTGAGVFGRTCTLPPIALTFTGTNANATGTMDVGGIHQMTCTLSGGGTELNALPTQKTFNSVRVTGSNVVLSVSASDPNGNDGWTYNGNVSGNNVFSGTIAFRVPVNGTYATTTGSFTATRQ